MYKDTLYNYLLLQKAPLHQWKSTDRKGKPTSVPVGTKPGDPPPSG